MSALSDAKRRASEMGWQLWTGAAGDSWQLRNYPSGSLFKTPDGRTELSWSEVLDGLDAIAVRIALGAVHDAPEDVTPAD